MRRLALVLVLLAGCATGREGWGGGSYTRVFENEDLQIRSGRVVVDREAGEVFVRWIGVRATPNAPAIVELQLLIFADRDRDGDPDDGEILDSSTVRERTHKILLPSIRLPLIDPVEDLKARAIVHTEGRGRTKTWRLVEEP